MKKKRRPRRDATDALYRRVLRGLQEYTLDEIRVLVRKHKEQWKGRKHVKDD